MPSPVARIFLFALLNYIFDHNKLIIKIINNNSNNNSGTPLIRSPMGQKNLFVLTDGHDDKVTVGGRKAGFHCNTLLLMIGFVSLTVQNC